MARRFEAYGWSVPHVTDVNDLDAIAQAIEMLQGSRTRPTLIVRRTHIGYGSPNRQDTAPRTARRWARRRSS